VALPVILRNGSSDNEMRALGMSLGESVARVGPMRLAWIEFALVPALVLVIAHYTRRFVVARRGARRVGDPPGA
jgi:hypothetical protein